jgi:RiboL-PSP-HEPN
MKGELMTMGASTESANKAQIAERLDQNIARVRNLVDIYERHLAGSGSGRRGHKTNDVLRAAAVLLHASVEDLLRSLAYWRLPGASAEVLDKIPLASVAPASKFALGALATYRNKTVAEVIDISVNQYLERSNYNNPDEVSALLSSVGINVTKVNMWFTQLKELMDRRHQIVHRADRDETGGSGNYAVRSINRNTVRWWIDAVEKFGKAVLDELPA